MCIAVKVSVVCLLSAQLCCYYLRVYVYFWPNTIGSTENWFQFPCLCTRTRVTYIYQRKLTQTLDFIRVMRVSSPSDKLEKKRVAKVRLEVNTAWFTISEVTKISELACCIRCVTTVQCVPWGELCWPSSASWRSRSVQVRSVSYLSICLRWLL